MNKYSSIVLRMGIAIVMVWFGISQVMSPESWTSFLPDFILKFKISDINLIYANGIFEILAGVLLFFGFFIRTVSLLLAIHLIGIIYSLGYTAIAIRDFGLAVALISIFLNGKNR